MTQQGLIGGDCGSILSQIYECAGGAVSRPFDGKSTSLYLYINYNSVSTAGPGQSPGLDFPVWKANSIEDLDAQLKKAGGPKFGDIFVIGQFGKGQHNFMYTGGRSDVPFDVFEMGGGGDFDGVVGPQVSIKRANGNSFAMGGMRTHPNGGLYRYIEGYGKPNCSSFQGTAYKYCVSQKGLAWPVTVARPYEYTLCQHKAECQDMEVCQCTYGDSKDHRTLDKECGSKNICRKIFSASYMNQYSMLCENNENCPKGWSCPEEGTARRCKKD
jgi:hypothetical protein